MGSKKIKISKEKSQIFLDSHCQLISVDNSQYEAEIGLHIEKSDFKLRNWTSH